MREIPTPDGPDRTTSLGWWDVIKYQEIKPIAEKLSFEEAEEMVIDMNRDRRNRHSIVYAQEHNHRELPKKGSKLLT